MPQHMMQSMFLFFSESVVVVCFTTKTYEMRLYKEGCASRRIVPDVSEEKLDHFGLCA